MNKILITIITFAFAICLGFVVYNYGLKPTEAKIKPESGSGNIKVKTGTKLKNFSLILECHKESGFTTI